MQRNQPITSIAFSGFGVRALAVDLLSDAILLLGLILVLIIR